MINSKEMMQQICMDRSEAETILTALAQLSMLCQKYAVVSMSSDSMRLSELEYELGQVNDKINRSIIGIYTHRTALKNGITTATEEEKL